MEISTLTYKFVCIVAGISVAFCSLGWWLAPQQFFMAWLTACLFVWSISIGSLTLLLVFCMTGGRWGVAAWPWLSMNARLMPLVALLFIPWTFGIDTIYPWANSDVLSRFENTANRQWLYQIPFYLGRTVLYFTAWSILAWMVAGFPWSAGPVDGKSLHRRMIVGGQAVAGLGLILILLTVTWSGIDWVMSFDPFFTSTLFGAMIGIGALLSSMSAVVAAVCFWKPMHEVSVDGKAISDLSNLLLAFLMLWAYFSFAHFLIMWTGDLPQEAGFYAARTSGIWHFVAPALSIGGFVVPFLCLLSHDFKRTPHKVGALALFLLCVRLIELWWMVLPAAGGEKNWGLTWIVIPSSLAVIAIYMFALLTMMDSLSRRTAARLQ